VAALGRAGGGAAYWLDARHRRVAMLNLARCFPGRAPRQLRLLLREHFRRLGENYTAAVKTSAMKLSDLEPHLEITGVEKFTGASRGAIVAVGHFGNFELYARMDRAFDPLQRATTYRPLKQPRLDALVRRLRQESGCVFFDRKRDGSAMRSALAKGGVVVGLLCDQHAGSGGLRVPFFGHACSVTSAPAILAQRYDLPLHTAICFRVAPARWRIEIGDAIPTRAAGGRRPPAEVMRDVNAVFEEAVRRDPANWLWVHDRWRFFKGARNKMASGEPVPA
jgi:KDO2-lipid IV(A) lauroyltransferase